MSGKIVSNSFVLQAKARDGADGISRWLVATPSAVSFRSDATGSFSSNAQVTVACAVWKRVGSGSEQQVTAVDGLFDGLCLRMRRMKSDGSWYDSAWVDSAETTVTWALALDSGVSSVEFRLSRSVGASSPHTPDGIVASFSVPVTCDGRRGAQGESVAGSPGVSYVPMGLFDPYREYTRDDYTVPVVFYDDGTWNAAEECYGHYYELALPTNLIGSVYYEPGDTYGGAAVWTLLPNYSLVVARGLIAPYGKIGSGIFCGDFFYSANGRVGAKDYAAGATIGSRPAYARFTGDPEAEKSLKTYEHGSDLNGPTPASLTAGVHTVASVYLAAGTVFHFRFQGKKGSSSSVDFVLRDPDGDEVVSRALQTTWGEDTCDYTAVRNGYHTLQLEAEAANSLYLHAEYRTQGVFEPNWWVNLLTGKMSAARGNFVVNPDGSVKVHNLYHDICVAGQEKYAYLSDGTFFWDYEDCDWVSNFRLGGYYTEEQARALSDGQVGIDSMDKCTYDADIVVVPNMPNTSGVRHVCLPCASDFEGKMVEVIDNAYTNGQPMGDIRVHAADGGDFGGGIWSGGVQLLDDYATVTAGTKARFYSICDDGTWFWLKMP